MPQLVSGRAGIEIHLARLQSLSVTTTGHCLCPIASPFVNRLLCQALLLLREVNQLARCLDRKLWCSEASLCLYVVEVRFPSPAHSKPASPCTLLLARLSWSPRPCVGKVVLAVVYPMGFITAAWKRNRGARTAQDSNL